MASTAFELKGKTVFVAGHRGMVGSAQGWAEAPYVPCPADTGSLAGKAVAVESASGVRVLIAARRGARARGRFPSGACGPAGW